MKRADIKVGEEYAYCRRDPGYGQPCQKVTVLGFDEVPVKPRYSWEVPTGKVETWPKVRFDHGEERTVPSREIRWLWEHEIEIQKVVAEDRARSASISQAIVDAFPALKTAFEALGIQATVVRTGHVEIRLYRAEAIRALTAALERAVEADRGTVA